MAQLDLFPTRAAFATSSTQVGFSRACWAVQLYTQLNWVPHATYVASIAACSSLFDVSNIGDCTVSSADLDRAFSPELNLYWRLLKPTSAHPHLCLEDMHGFLFGCCCAVPQGSASRLRASPMPSTPPPSPVSLSGPER